jgi:hypothetical protein
MPLLFVLLAFTGMFLGFHRNQWDMARPKKFSTFQKDVEAYVIGRLVLTRESGVFASGGLLGWGDVNPSDINDEDYQYQYDAYLTGLSFQTYLPKESHPGFQGIFFSLLDRLSPFSASTNLRIFRGLASALLAATLTGLLVWFYRNLGWFPSILSLASILTSQWITLFGRNLFFFTWIFYLPLVVLLFVLQAEEQGKSLSNKKIFWLFYFLILIKTTFNGFDFILPALGMAASPFIFYAVQDKWKLDRFLRRFLLIIAAALLAILTSLLILSVQDMLASGSFQNGVSYILETINRRTLSSGPNLDPVYAEASQVSVWTVLNIYLSESYFFKLPISYFSITVLFAFVSLGSLYFGRLEKKTSSSKGMALAAMTWFSFMASVSWYVIFKSLAVLHTHMNYLPWHMPFTIIGFAMCGYFLEGAARAVFHRADGEV